jgi:hypothetical protein
MVDGGADVGEPLHVLDAAQAGPERLGDVGDGLVALQVDEVLGQVLGGQVPAWLRGGDLPGRRADH